MYNELYTNIPFKSYQNTKKKVIHIQIFIREKENHFYSENLTKHLNPIGQRIYKTTQSLHFPLQTHV